MNSRWQQCRGWSARSYQPLYDEAAVPQPICNSNSRNVQTCDFTLTVASCNRLDTNVGNSRSIRVRVSPLSRQCIHRIVQYPSLKIDHVSLDYIQYHIECCPPLSSETSLSHMGKGVPITMHDRLSDFPSHEDSLLQIRIYHRPLSQDVENKVSLFFHLLETPSLTTRTAPQDTRTLCPTLV